MVLEVNQLVRLQTLPPYNVVHLGEDPIRQPPRHSLPSGELLEQVLPDRLLHPSWTLLTGVDNVSSHLRNLLPKFFVLIEDVGVEHAVVVLLSGLYVMLALLLMSGYGWGWCRASRSGCGCAEALTAT